MVPSYNRYSHHARRALTHAILVVTRMAHPFADTGHLLVGVMLTEGSLGFQVLDELDFDLPRAQDVLYSLSPSLSQPLEEVRNADDLNIALSLAADESAWLGHHYIGTEHLLLGITRSNVGNARALLRQLDISPEQIRRRVRQILTIGASELNLQAAKRNARLSELSRRVITAAEQTAVVLDHHTVGLGHLLLELLREDRSPTSALLSASGLDGDSLWRSLEASDGLLLVSVEPVLNQVLDLAESLGSHYTGTEHLLLAVASDDSGAALLDAYGVDPGALRQRIRAHAGQNTPRPRE